MIEIRELTVRVNINSQPQNGATQNNGNAGSNLDKKAIIDECLEQVAKMLKNQNER